MGILGINLFSTKNVSKTSSVKSTTVSKASTSASKDWFQGSDVLQSAREFSRHVKQFLDYGPEGLPRDGQEGSQVLKKTLTPHIEKIKELNSEDLNHFSKLCLNKKVLQSIHDGSHHNSTVKELRHVLEKGLGSTLEHLIKQSH